MTASRRTRMITSTVAAMTVGGAGIALGTVQAHALADYRDVAYGISATGAAPINATPMVSRTGRDTRSDSGSARSSDGTIAIASATVTAGEGQADATVTGFTAFDGLVSATTVTASCRNATVTSGATGTSAGGLGRRGSVAYNVRTTNQDGSRTVIGMQVRVQAGRGVEAATINVASATCTAVTPSPTPSPTRTTAPTSSPTRTTTPTTSPTRTHTAEPTRKPPAESPPTRTTTRPAAPPVVSPGGAATGLGPAPVPTPRTTHLPVTG